jgi:kexin
VVNPEDPDWEDTHAGRPYSYKYGFGKIDGYAYVMAAKDWTLVKPQAWFETETVQIAGGTMGSDGDMQGGELIPPGGALSTIKVTQEMLQDNNFESLEHITVKVWISHTRRGDVTVEVVSPNGIKSVLAWVRTYDKSNDGFPGWTFMTVKHW